ncbi:hypothetical protein TSUD_369120, partial [Trifolium subterraneum]
STNQQPSAPLSETNQQPRAPLSELAKESNCVSNLPDRHHIVNDKFNNSGQNDKSQLKKDDPKISALIQIIDSENMENLWKPLLEFLNRTDIIGEKIEVLQLVSRTFKELKSSTNERGHSGLRKMEPDEDSPGSSEYSSGSTLLPKSTGTGDNLESSLNQDTGTEMKATQFGVKKEECEDVEGVLSTGKVEQDMMPHGEEQINPSSRMECSPLQVTPIFRSLAEGIPTPEFSESGDGDQ